MDKIKVKCPRCGNYSVVKKKSDLLQMLIVDIFAFFGAIILSSGFAVIIFLILLTITIIMVIVKTIQKIRKKSETKYECKSCGVEFLKNQLNFKI